MKTQNPNDQRSNVKNPNNPQFADDMKNRIRMKQKELSAKQTESYMLKEEIKTLQRELSETLKSKKGGIK